MHTEYIVYLFDKLKSIVYKYSYKNIYSISRTGTEQYH